MPGDGRQLEEAARAAFKGTVNRYSTLHKLLVQQSPRNSVAGLMWLLECAGFSRVCLSTALELYHVNGNAFPGLTAAIACCL
eukprot:gene3307-3583_t